MIRRSRTRQHALRWGGCAIVALGLLIVSAAQKAYERQLFEAATEGDPCAALKPGEAAGRSLRRYAFEDLTFAYGRGDLDCQMMKPGRAFGDEALPVCTFQHPDLLVVQGRGVHAAYAAPLGQATVVRNRGGLVCHARML